MANELTPSQVIGYWYQAGGSETTAADALAHAYAESSLNPEVTSSNPDGGTNVGLWQLDTPGGVGAGYSVQQLQDPLTNARLTVKGSSDGQNWSQWPDAWQDFIAQAKSDVEGYTGTTGRAAAGSQQPSGEAGQIGGVFEKFLDKMYPGLDLGGQGAGIPDLTAVAAGLTGLAKDFELVGKITNWLTLPTNWTRVFAGIMGGAFVGASIYLLGKEAKGA